MKHPCFYSGKSTLSTSLLRRSDVGGIENRGMANVWLQRVAAATQS